MFGGDRILAASGSTFALILFWSNAGNATLGSQFGGENGRAATDIVFGRYGRGTWPGNTMDDQGGCYRSWHGFYD